MESINSTNSNRRGIMGCEDELDTSIEPGGAGNTSLLGNAPKYLLFWCVIQKRTFNIVLFFPF